MNIFFHFFFKNPEFWYGRDKIWVKKNYTPGVKKKFKKISKKNQKNFKKNFLLNSQNFGKVRPFSGEKELQSWCEKKNPKKILKNFFFFFQFFFQKS